MRLLKRAPRAKKQKADVRKGLKEGFDSLLEKRFFDTYHKTRYLKFHPFTMEYRVEETRKYTPDFEDLTSGVIYEVKGYFDAASRSKMKRIKKFAPNLKIVMCFDKDNLISKNGKTRYSDWCKKNGIDYCLDLDIENVVVCPPRVKKVKNQRGA